jgi:hypothetical protein
MSIKPITQSEEEKAYGSPFNVALMVAGGL